MNVLEYNDSNYREKQEQKEKEDFAIGFAEWIDSDFYQGDDVNEYHKSILEYRDGKIFTVKELLEIYKNDTTRKV